LKFSPYQTKPFQRLWTCWPDCSRSSFAASAKIDATSVTSHAVQHRIWYFAKSNGDVLELESTYRENMGPLAGTVTEFLLISLTSRPALGPNQPPIRSHTVGESSWGIELTAYFHLVPWLRMHVAITPLYQYVFVTWCLV